MKKKLKKRALKKRAASGIIMISVNEAKEGILLPGHAPYIVG